VAAQTQITEAPELRTAAQPIIHEHHPYLLDARILYLFTSAKTTRAGRLRTGVAKRLSPEQRFLSSGLESVEDGYDFMVVVNKTRYRALTSQQQSALLDHELCHCAQKVTLNRRTGAVTVRWITRGHDVEEFREIVQRHGLWNPDVKQLVHAGAQLALPVEAESPGLQVRTTAVDEQGTVVETRLEPEQEQIEAGADLEDATEESGDIAQENLPGRVAIGHTSWQDATHLGQSEPEHRRRARRKS
jgi:hypothetical protein